MQWIARVVVVVVSCKATLGTGTYYYYCSYIFHYLAGFPLAGFQTKKKKEKREN